MDTNSSTSFTPPLETNNTRALLIFTTYLTTNTLLTLLIISSIFKAYKTYNTTTTIPATKSSPHARSKPPRFSTATITLFTTLATLSLAITWHYMLSFFALSYRSWAVAHDVPVSTTSGSGWSLESLQHGLSDVRLGPWLKDVQLFRDAWETVLETPSRTVWSLPIFWVTVGWSVFIGREAPKRKIKHAWAYMVLGQLVAISFAMNLFYIAVLVNRPDLSDGAVTAAAKADIEYERSQQNSVDTKQKKENKRTLSPSTLWTPPHGIYAILIPFTMATVIYAVTAAGKPHFLFMLTVPHVLLLIPPILHVVIPRTEGSMHPTVADYDNYFKVLFRIVVAFGLFWELAYLGFCIAVPTARNVHTHRHSNVHRYPWEGQGVVMHDETAFQGIWRSLFDHPAVSSVGWDGVLCMTSLVVWKLTASSRGD